MTINLTNNQQAALNADGDVMVTAAAGSGKTRVLTMRILRAVLDQGVDLRHIVAVTYTRRAADEIRMRVAAALVQRGRFDLVALLDQATIGTIHNLCGRIVRRHGSLLGIDPGVRMLDETTCRWEMRQAVRWACSELSVTDYDVAMLRSRWGDDRIERIIIAAHRASQQRVDPHVTFVPEGMAVSSSDLRDLTALDQIMRAALTRYEYACRAHGGVDFDQIQRLALELLTIDDVRLDIRSQVSRLLVDEFQDTNALQCAIIDAIGDACTFAVGDEFQSIYRFRAADVEVFRQRRDTHHNVLAMPENFRSHPAILEVVNAVFTSTFGSSYQPVIAGRVPPDSQMTSPRPELRVAIASSIDEARSIEASHVASRVVELCNSGASPGEIALLFPRSSQSQIFVDALRSAGIRTVQSSSRGYHRHDAVRDLVNLLAWVSNPADDRVTLGVLSSPIVGLAPRDLRDLRSIAGPDESIWSAVLTSARSETNHLCSDACSMIDLHARLVTLAARTSLPVLVDQAIHGTPLAARAISGPDGVRAYANLRKLIDIAAAANRDGIRRLADLVSLLRAQTSFNQEGEANIAEEGTDAVRIMTVHAAKGLEFPHAFICDLGNHSTPPFDALLDTSGVAWVSRRDDTNAEWVKPPRFIELEAVERAEQAEELTRLMYVAMTRAEQSLWMSASVTWTSAKQEKAKVSGAAKWLLDALDWDIVAQPAPGVHHGMPMLMSRIDAPASCPPLIHAQAQGITPHLGEVMYESPVLHAHALGHDQPRDQVGVHHDVSQRELVRVGERLHAALAASLVGIDTSSWSCDEAERAILDTVHSSDIYRRLAALGARPEVSWHAAIDGELSSGRFDALVIDGNAWWIVDWKYTLGHSERDVWALHGEQFGRYMAAALASGASQVTLTAVSLSDPNHVHEWHQTAVLTDTIAP